MILGLLLDLYDFFWVVLACLVVFMVNLGLSLGRLDSFCFVLSRFGSIKISFWVVLACLE